MFGSALKGLHTSIGHGPKALIQRLIIICKPISGQAGPLGIFLFPVKKARPAVKLLF